MDANEQPDTDRHAAELTALRLIADARSVPILGALEAGPLAQGVLEAAVQRFPHATLHGRLTALQDAGAIERVRTGNSVRCALAPAGTALLALDAALSRWQATAPGSAAHVAPWALAAALQAGWLSGLLPALTLEALPRGPLGDRLPLSYHQLQGRLRTAARTGLIEARGAGAMVRYGLTPFGRGAMGVIILAIAWQRRHRPATTWTFLPAHLSHALRIALPLLDLGEAISGVLVLTVTDEQPGTPTAGMGVLIAKGRAVAFPPVNEQPATAVIHGTLAQWDAALVGREPAALTAEGDRRLTDAFLRKLPDRLGI